MKRSIRLPLAAGVVVALLMPQLARAQAANRPLVQYQYANPMGQSLNWLFNPQVQKELELVPEQIEKIKKIRSDSSSKMRDMYKSLGDVEPGERQKKYYEKYREMGEESDKKVQEVLLDHQVDRLRQIILQMKLRGSGYGAASAIASDEVAKALGLTDAQKEALRKKEAEVRGDMRVKSQEFYQKLRDEARQELLSVLSAAQRDKLNELTGADFEWQATAWQRGKAGATGVKVGEIRKKE